MVEEKTRFQSVEELMDYVEREAERRIAEITGKYRQLHQAYDQIILKVLRESKEPMSVDLISFLTGINKSRCCKILNKLEKKWKLIRKVTVSKTTYYEAL